MWKYIIFGLLLGVGAFGSVYWYLYMSGSDALEPARTTLEKITEKPLEKYTFENLRKTEFEAGKITIGERVEEESDEFDSYIYYFEVKNLNEPEKPYRASGLMNIPTEVGEYPVIVQFRGFVPTESFTPGEGTRRSGEYFASNAFITLAPDYLGFGESDKPSEDALEERFQTYTMALSMLASVKNINKALDEFEVENNTQEREEGEAEENEIESRWNGEDIGIWGHSNGGHISLSALALSGVKYPTVLWNPVSKAFPYSILYYTDEYEDEGVGLRRLIADFESTYDISFYSPPNYYKWIKAPIQLHQGLTDREILPWWSEELAKRLEEEDVEVEYITYPNADHNLMPDGWNSAVVSSVEYYVNKFEAENED